MKQLILLLVLLVVFGSETAGQQYAFRQYSDREGLHHSFVYAINQDRDGYLWIGTPGGLYQFNGLEFEHLAREDGIADDFVTTVYCDRDGQMWLGHQNGSVSVHTKSGFKILSLESVMHGAISDITEDARGTIWIAAQSQGVFSISKELQVNQVAFPVEEEQITQIQYAGQNSFIIGTYENLYTARYDSLSSFLGAITRIEEYPQSKVVEIIVDSPGNYIIVSQEDGLFGLGLHLPSGNHILSTYDSNNDGALNNLQGALLDSKGRLWLNSIGTGITQFRKDATGGFGRSGQISTGNGLLSGNVKALFEDFEGNLWLGMYGEGLLRFIDNNLQSFTFGLEGRAGKITAVAGNSSYLLFSSGDRLLQMDLMTDSITHSYPLPLSEQEDQLNTIYLPEDGSIWLGYERNGLYVSGKSDFRFTSFPISRDNLSQSINHITGANGFIWVSTKKGICKIAPATGLLKWFNTDQGLPHNNVKQLYLDSKKQMLVATLCNEIYYIDQADEVGVMDGSSMAPFTSVVSIREDSNENLWIATQGNGIWKIDWHNNQNYTSSSGLLSDYCYGLILTGNGESIVTHSGGLSQIDPVSNHIKTFSQYEGVNSSAEFYDNEISRDRRDRIWMGTSQGLLRYTPDQQNTRSVPPRIKITAVLVDGDSIDFNSNEIHLKSGRYELAVDYIGISLSNPEMVFYQTQLEGYNRDWSAPTFNRKVIFDRVEHGNYTFRLQAFNENDISSVLESGFQLKIKKPVYLSIWFYVIISLVIGFSFFAIIRIRERNHRMVQERLLRNIDEKTKEIIVKEEIIKERKKVEKILIEAKTKAELSEKLKTSFLQNMSHEIRTPMNAIVGFTQLLKEDNLSVESRDEFIDNVSVNAEALLKLIDDILDLSKLETNQLEVSQESCNVKILLTELEAVFRKRLENEVNKDIELVTSDPSESELNIITDKLRLKQIMTHLLDNALKFTESGTITFGYTLDDQSITFYVRDTGIGLSEDKKGIVFDLFRKAEDDRYKLYGGTGLGLTLSKYLVTLMGGKINLDSAEGEGSCFYFTLPLRSKDILSHPNSITDEN